MHSHTHGQHHHHGTGSVLRWSLIATALFVVVELIAGLKAHSLALLSDAAHMLTDAAALALALLAARLAILGVQLGGAGGRVERLGGAAEIVQGHRLQEVKLLLQQPIAALLRARQRPSHVLEGQLEVEGDFEAAARMSGAALPASVCGVAGVQGTPTCF